MTCCSFFGYADFVGLLLLSYAALSLDLRLPAKQNVIKQPPTPPLRASRAHHGKRHRQKNAESAKREIASNMVSESQEFNRQANFLELRTKSQLKCTPKTHVSFVHKSKKAVMRQKPLLRRAQHLTSARRRKPRAGRCFPSEGKAPLQERGMQQHKTRGKATPESEPGV